MARLTPLARLRVPLGGQEIELQQVDHDIDELDPRPAASERDAPVQDGGHTSVPMRMLRTRIREKSRFTIFDVDPITAQAWGEALIDWAQRQPRE